MTTVKMVAPPGVTGQVTGNGTSYTIASDGSVSVDSSMVPALLSAGFQFFRLAVEHMTLRAPAAADLISIKAAATPANGAITIAAQPDYARKLQVRVVIGTSPTTAITAGILTLVGVDQDGNAITEDVSLVTTTSVTLKTKYAYAELTSGTVAGYVASGSGTGNTLGLGVANDLGVTSGAGASSLTCVKAMKAISTFTGSGTAVTTVAVVPTDDVAATCTVDTVARTIAPTTAPGPTATTSTDYTLSYTFGLAD
jgi:hypothetical protein